MPVGVAGGGGRGLTDQVGFGGDPAVSARRRRWSWLMVVVILLAIVVPTIGARNPWHLVLVDRVLFHPVLAGCVVATCASWLCYLHIRHLGVQLLMCGAIGAVALVWALRWWFFSPEPTGPPILVAADPYNDVEVAFRTSDRGFSVSILLRADRGLASRENEVGLMPTGGSDAPVVEARFDAPDRLTVTHQGEVVFRAEFDPHDLDLVDAQCYPTRPPGVRPVILCTG